MINQNQKYISIKGNSEHLSKRLGILSERMVFLSERFLESWQFAVHTDNFQLLLFSPPFFSIDGQVV